MGSESYIKASAKRAQMVLKEHTLYDDIQIVIKDKIQQDIDLNNIFRTIEDRVPQHLFRELDIIYVGQFPQLKVRGVESAYMNGAIFISNLIVDEDTFLKSIIHEVAHNAENIYGRDIYGDQYSLIWETQVLKDLGSTLNILVGEIASFIIQQGIQGTLLAYKHFFYQH